MDIKQEATPVKPPRLDVMGDIHRVFEVLQKSGIAICANTVGYGIWRGSPEALNRMTVSTLKCNSLPIDKVVLLQADFGRPAPILSTAPQALACVQDTLRSVAQDAAF